MKLVCFFPVFLIKYMYIYYDGFLFNICWEFPLIKRVENFLKQKHVFWHIAIVVLIWFDCLNIRSCLASSYGSKPCFASIEIIKWVCFF